MSRLKDIPELERDGKNLNAVMQVVREVLQTFRGYRGDPLDQAMTLRDATSRGVLLPSGAFAGSSVPGPAGPVGPAGPAGSTYTPDLTAPPTPTGLVVTAGLASIFISCDTQVYTQGHGHDRTIVYGAKWPSGAAPTFSSAVELFEYQGTSGAYPTETGTRWCIWIKWRSNDAVLSTAPAGGTNGVQATTGKIGNADLNNLIITSEKLSAGTYPNINLVANGSAEDGIVAWSWAQISGTPTFSLSTTQYAGGSQSFQMTKTGTEILAAFCTAFPIIPGETYSVKVRFKSTLASASGVYIQMFERPTKPTSGYVDAGNYSGFSTLYADGPSTTAWVIHEFSYTASAGQYWASVAIYAYTAFSGGDLFFDDVSVGRQITASFLAANSIAVGSAAIQNGAIVNAMIGNAAIDDAKIANLSAAKLTAGTGVIGGNLSSSNYVAGTSGWLLTPAGFFESQNALLRGTVYASAGLIGGVTIDPTAIRAGQSAYDTGTGFWIGASGSFSVGNSAGNKLTWNGTNLNIVGGGTFSGALSAATGTFAGSLSAAVGTFSGSVNVGNFTGYAWPAAGGTGAHLGPNGLLMGNPNVSAGNPGGKYFQVYTPAGGAPAILTNIPAYLDDLQVTTLKIAGQAVTIPSSSYVAGAITYSAPETTIGTLTFTSTGAQVYVHFTAFLTGDVSATYSTVRIKRNGSTIYSQNVDTIPSGSGSITSCAITDTPVAGSVTYSVTSAAATGTSGASARSLFALEMKK